MKPRFANLSSQRDGDPLINLWLLRRGNTIYVFLFQKFRQTGLICLIWQNNFSTTKLWNYAMKTSLLIECLAPNQLSLQWRLVSDYQRNDINLNWEVEISDKSNDGRPILQSIVMKYPRLFPASQLIFHITWILLQVMLAVWISTFTSLFTQADSNEICKARKALLVARILCNNIETNFLVSE